MGSSRLSPESHTKPKLRLLGLVLAGLGALCLSAGTVWAEPAKTAKTEEAGPPAPPRDEIQKTITLLEDPQRRQELITLLKLLAAVETQTQTGEGTPRPADGSAAALGPPTGLNAWLARVGEEVWRNVSSSKVGLGQSWGEMKAVFQTLARPEVMAIWRPYVLNTCLWGFFWLAATIVIVRRYGQAPPPDESRTLLQNWGRQVKHFLVLTGPSLVLTFSILALPRLNSTAPGVTADMAIGFSFLHALLQYFFADFSILYISLRLLDLLFPNTDSKYSLFRLNPLLAVHFRHTGRIFAAYMAFFIFFKETFLEHFAGGPLYLFCVSVLTVAVAVYLTGRLLRLKHLVGLLKKVESTAVGLDDSAEAMSNTDLETETVLSAPPSRLEYRTDTFLRRHWALLAIIALWCVTLMALFSPANSSDSFVGRTFFSFLLIIAAALLIKGERLLLLRLSADEEAEQGRRLALNVDLFANIVVWIALIVGLSTVWGFPLGRILENEVTRDVLGRAVAIGITIAALVIFIRFSRLATEWLLSVPSLGENRNWRTMAPLLLTTVRALAIFVSVVVVLERLGVNVGPILAGAGILGLGVGMGAQSLVKDIINGISILLMDTLAVGDYVTIGGKSGTVEALGLRSIRLRDPVGSLTVVPNSSVDIIVNQTRDYSQELVDFTVPCDADPDLMLKMAEEVATDLSRDPLWQRRLSSPVILMGVVAFDANGTTIRLKINTIPGQQWAAGRELRLRLKRRMLHDGLKSIWFCQNVCVFNGDKAAAAEAAPDEAEPRLADSTSVDDGGLFNEDEDR